MAKGGSIFLRFLAWAAGLGLLALGAAGIALKVLLPPAKIKKLVIEKASEALHREVRLRDVSVGLLKGLTLDGLEVSENPDFKAGKFLAIDQFVLKVRLMPLLHKKVVVDEIGVVRPLISVIKDKKGRFNFDDLTAPPPAASAAAGRAKKSSGPAAPPIAFELKVRKASMTGGKIAYSDRGAGISVDLAGIQAVATSLDFDQATGKLSVILDKLAAGVSGLEVRVAGAVKLDPKKLEVPDLHGRFGDGDLKLSMTVRDYLKAPDVSLDATLSSLDLDRLMAVKQATMGAGQAGGGNPQTAATAAPASASSGPAVKTKGQAVIGQMTYGTTKVNETKLSWELGGVTPDLRGVAGWAKLHIAGGSFSSGSKDSGRSGLVKAMMLPVTVLQSIGGLLAPLKILPDLSHLLFTEVVGDYVFSRGVMTIRDFHMDSAAANVKTTGTIDLGAQRLALLAAIAPVNVAPIEVDVTGTFDHPSVKPRLTKLLTAPGKNVVDQASKLLKGLFKR